MDARLYLRPVQGSGGTGRRQTRVSCDYCSASCIHLVPSSTDVRLQERKSSDAAVTARLARDVPR